MQTGFKITFWYRLIHVGREKRPSDGYSVCSKCVVSAPSQRTTRASVYSMRNGTFRVEYKPTEVGTYIIQADTARLDFDKPLSSVAALIPQSPLPSHLRSWLPSTKRSYFTVASLHFLSSSLFFSPSFFPFSRPHLPPPVSPHI